MPLLEILTFPDPALKKKSKPVDVINHHINELLDNMSETMYDAPGVGLAAPQVGENLRVITVDVSPRDSEKRDLIELINPEIISFSGSQLGEEGCLSVPGFNANVKRKLNVKVRALDREGKTFEVEATDLFSRVLQHEIDHLDGILFFDRLGRLKKELLLKKIKKALPLS